MQRTRSTRRYLKKQKSWAQKCKDFIREFVAFMFSNVGIIGLVIGYTIAGSFMFIAIETRLKEDKAAEVGQLRDSTVEELWEATCCRLFDDSVSEWERRVEHTLTAFQSQLVLHIQEGGYEGTEVNEQTRWSFSGAFLYSLTVITTIGYGNIAPRTGWGKLATILYAIVGMPLFLLYLSNIGDILAKSFKWTYAKCCLCRGCKQNRDDSFSSSLHNQEMEMGEEVCSLGEEEQEYLESDPQSVTVPITLCLAIMVGYIYGGAILFGSWEKWSLLDGAYFCFISLSTIGFGDIVPGDMLTKNEPGLRFIICSMYLMLGMALIAMCFNLMQEEVVHKIRSFGDSVRRITRCQR